MWDVSVRNTPRTIPGSEIVGETDTVVNSLYY